jgi:hypothetical protein
MAFLAIYQNINIPFGNSKTDTGNFFIAGIFFSNSGTAARLSIFPPNQK